MKKCCEDLLVTYREERGRLFICTSLQFELLKPFTVFFATLSACTAQGGIWPSAAKASFTPPQKAVYYLVGNSMHVIPLFPECRTLQMNLNCLARYQYNKLKRSKAHSPTAALERCCPRGAVGGGTEWPPLSWAPRTICFRPPKPPFHKQTAHCTLHSLRSREVGQMTRGWKAFDGEQARGAAGPLAAATPWSAVR